MKLLSILLLFASCAVAQDQPHKFFDKPARVSLITAAGLDIADAAQTCHALSEGNSEAWLPVKHCPGIPLWLVGSFSVQTGTAFLLHRNEHHKLERVVEFIEVAGPIAGLSWSLTHPPVKRVPLPPIYAPGTRVTGFCIVGQTC